MNAELRKVERQLAKATRTMREVAERLEARVKHGPVVLEATDLLEFAAQLLAARQSILAGDVPATTVRKRTRAASIALLNVVPDSSALLRAKAVQVLPD